MRATPCVDTLTWVSKVSPRDSRFFVKGTVLNVAKYGQYGRYMIYDTRHYDEQRNADRAYFITDAHTVSDLDVAKGIAAKIIARAEDLHELEDELTKLA